MPILVQMVAVMITRDAQTILPRDVPAHELPVLHAVFGEDNVQLQEGVNPGAVELDPANEAERLAGKYGTDALERTHGKNFAGAIVRACKEAEAKPEPEAKPEAKAPKK